MSPLQAATLGAIQGLTEFVPISSSAHLFVIPRMLGWPYAGVSFDVALHMGTVLALLAAFWRDWWNLAKGLFDHAQAARSSARSAWLKIAVASVPAMLAGLWLEPFTES